MRMQVPKTVDDAESYAKMLQQVLYTSSMTADVARVYFESGRWYATLNVAWTEPTELVVAELDVWLNAVDIFDLALAITEFLNVPQQLN